MTVTGSVCEASSENGNRKRKLDRRRMDSQVKMMMTSVDPVLMAIYLRMIPVKSMAEMVGSNVETMQNKASEVF